MLTRKPLLSARHGLHALLLFITTMLLSGCSSDNDEPDIPSTSGPYSLQMKITAKSPAADVNVLMPSSYGSDKSKQFTSHHNASSPQYDCWAKQDGKLYYLDEVTGTMTNSGNDEAEFNIDVTGKVLASKPFEVYGLGCSWRRDGEDLFYRRNLVRGGNFGSYFKVSGGQQKTSVTESIDGTVEILYVVNTTDKPISFRHKGFDAEKKWYYTYAEVSIDNGKIENTEQGAEAVSEVKDVPIYTKNNGLRLYSYYVPNGNKIQDAQLIAEIDGKEVRSVNRISSDVTIEINHAYGIFAIWDGEKLTLGDEQDESVLAVTHVFSSETGNENEDAVSEVKDDGTVILSSNAAIPKVGEVIVSDGAPGAPDGFLYRVESVRSANGGTILTTSPACLNEIIGECNERISLNFNEIESFTRTDGKVYTPTRTDVEWNFIEVDTLFKVHTDTLTAFQSGNLSGSISMLVSVKLGASLSGEFICEKKKGEFDFERFGLELSGELSCKTEVNLSAKIKYEKKISLGVLKLRKKVVWLAGVPLVFTPRYLTYLVLKADGEAYLTLTPIDLSLKLGVKAMYSCYPDPATGKYFNVSFTGTKWEEIKDFFSAEKVFQKLLDPDEFADAILPSFGLKASLKAGLQPMLEVSFYGSDRAAIGVGFTPFLKLTGDLSINLSSDDGFDLQRNCMLTDKLDLDWGVDADAWFRLPIKLPFDVPGTTYNEAKKEYTIDTWNIIERPLVSLVSLLPTYHNFRALPEENAHLTSVVRLRAEREKPLFVICEEDDYGFCYCEKGTIDWQYVSLKDKYQNASYGLDQSFTMEYDLPTAGLKNNATYYVLPYSHLKGFNWYVTRKGGKFKTGAEDTNIISPLDDVIGSDL